jgi:uncharacterized protein DUF4032/lipopolysaccharide kinase (Kdo/WaaP) family protein
MSTFPHLHLRDPAIELVDLPWEQPLAAWPAETLAFRELPVGPSRHLVRFLTADGALYALKELPLDVGRREYAVLLHLEGAGLPAVAPAGIAEAQERGTAILATEYLAHSLQYRRLLMRLTPGPSVHRDRLLDAMAFLLVDLHRNGVYWGDCSLANTLFRRDGDRIQAYLVDAETSEVHPALTDGQREYDAEILVENVAFGLADLAAMQEAPDPDESIAAAERVRDRYRAVWAELHDEPILRAGDRQGIRARVRRLNDLGYSVDVALDPTAGPDVVRLRMHVTTRRFHSREIERRTKVRALEGQARLLLNDLNEYSAWLEHTRGGPVPPQEAADRWLRDVYRPTLARIAGAVGPGRDLVQAYCDVLEQKWYLSEAAGRDIGLERAIEAYIELGAPAPETPSDRAASASVALDLERLGDEDATSAADAHGRAD